MDGSAALLLAAAVLLSASVVAQEDVPRLNCEEGDAPPPSRVDTNDRLIRLRSRMTLERVDAYVVLTNDDHQGEYVAPADARRAYISGFSGSSGWAVVTRTKAALWTDSRYYLQADQELDCNWILMRDGSANVPSMEQWLMEEFTQGGTVSADSKTVPNAQWESWLKSFGDNLVLRDMTPGTNLVDAVWVNRPDHSTAPVTVLDLNYAGVTWAAKVNDLAERVQQLGCQATVLSALDEIAWLLNLRGDDIPFTPFFRSYLTLRIVDGGHVHVDLYVDEDKIGAGVLQHLRAQEGVEVTVRAYESVWSGLGVLAAEVQKVLLPLRFSYNLGSSRAVHEQFPADKVITAQSLVSRMKDIKNEIEVAGMREANLRDSAALVKFLAELEDGVLRGDAWDERKASDRAAAIRKDMFPNINKGPSFESVSASGINSALPHYEPTSSTNSPINQSAVYTLDSGGHYLDGTTDVTRTIFIGNPEDIHKEVYTRLLSGCITLATAVFPLGTTQAALDVLVREPLFMAGLDYGHGSGHGIGHFGNVHEAYNTTLNENFFGSQEPGFYQAGDFGMRLENIVRVVRKDFNGIYVVPKKFLQFETVTFVPYEANLIDVSLLTEKQIEWLNMYHTTVKEKVTPFIQDNPLALKWLNARTQNFTANCRGDAKKLAAPLLACLFSVLAACIFK